MPSGSPSFLKTALGFLPFWFYVLLYKFGAGIHYSMIAVLGAQVLPLWAVGLAMALASGIQLVLDIPAGFLLERYGYIRMLRITTLCFVAAAGALLLGLTPATYLLSVGLSAFGWLFFTPGIEAYLMAHGPVPIIGRLFGLQRAMEGAGIVLALLGLPYFVELSPRVIGLVMLYPILGALAALAIGERSRLPTFLPKTTRAKRHAAQAGWQELCAAFRRLHPVGTALGLYTLAVATFYGTVWFVLPLLIDDGVASDVLSAGMTMLEFAVIISGMTIARFADSSKKKTASVCGMALVVVFALLLGATIRPVFIAICFFLSMADELVRTTLWAWLDAKAAGGRHHGIITGTVTFLEDLGWMLGPAAAGLLFTPLGAFLTLHVGGIFLTLCIILTVFLLLSAKHAGYRNA